MAGQTVSLPIAFGVIFWFYNIDFFLLRDVISLVFLCICTFVLFIGVHGMGRSVAGLNYLVLFIFKRLRLLVFLVLVGVKERWI